MVNFDPKLSFLGAFDFYRCGCHPGQQNWVRPLEVSVFIISTKFIKMMENMFQDDGKHIFQDDGKNI